jgi:PAT family beta-lactamase induction signal transducer AmpG
MSHSKWQRLFNRNTFIIALMGFSSGLPLALTGGTLQAWMKAQNVDLGTIGLFAFVGLPYTLKFLWAPLVDRFAFIGLGRRKSWMLTTQLGLILSVFWLSGTDPIQNLNLVAITALLVSFFSASQDIVLDAWRREALEDSEMGWGSSVHVASYLFSFRMISGALALILSDHFAFGDVYKMMAASLGLGLIATLMCHEPRVDAPPARTLREMVVDPFLDYFQKPGAILILIFILLYKVGDNMAAQMTMPFFLDLGFSRTEVGAITKVVGWIALASGGLIGGALIMRWSILRALFIFGTLQAISTLAFAMLASAGKNELGLTLVIAFENLTSGMGTAAFVAFMATLTNKRFSATQYALLTSLMGVPRTIVAAPTGYLAQSMGWVWFFVLCTVVALPGLMMIQPLSKKAT